MHSIFMFLSLISQVNYSKPESNNPEVKEFKFTAVNSPVTQSLSDVKFSNSQVGYICGAGGTVLKTTDAGANWSQLNTGSSGFFSTIFTVDTNIVYVGGFNGVFLKTTDGGNTWTPVTSPSSAANNHIWSIDFLDANTGFVTQGVDALKVYKTTNGGASWSATDLTGQGGIPGTSIQFLNNKSGFLTTGDPGTLLKTTDGGVTWEQKITGVSQGITDVFFLDSNNGFVCDHNGVVRKTTDGGSVWTTLSTGISTPLREIHFANTKIGIAVGDNRTVMSTLDGGSTWKKEDLGLTGFVQGIYFVNETLGFLTAEGGKFFKITLQ